MAGLREETAEWNRKGDEIEAKVMAMNAELEQLRKDNMRNALKYAIGGGRIPATATDSDVVGK